MDRFSLYGREIDISELECECRYNQAAKMLADDYASDFEEDYKKFGNLHTAVLNSSNLLKSLFHRASKIYVNALRERDGIYNIDEVDFLDKCGLESGYTIETFISLCDVYCKYAKEKIESDLYRENRKNSRMRISGGGFGLVEAAKGIVIAGIINTATGIAHSLYNELERTFDDSSLSSRMDEAYRKSIPYLKKAVWIDIYTMIYTYVSIIDCDFSWKYMNSASQKVWSGIKNAIDNDKNSKGTLPENIAGIVCSMADDKEIYLWAYNLLGDNNNELENLAKRLEVTEAVEMIRAKKNGVDAGRKLFGENYDVFMNTYKDSDRYNLIKDSLDGTVMDIAARLYFGKTDTNKKRHQFNEFVFCGKEYLEAISKIWEEDTGRPTILERYNNALECYNVPSNETPLFLFSQPRKTGFFSSSNDGIKGFLMTDSKLYFTTNKGYNSWQYEGMGKIVSEHDAIKIYEYQSENYYEIELDKDFRFLSNRLRNYIAFFCIIRKLLPDNSPLYDKNRRQKAKDFLGCLNLICSLYSNGNLNAYYSVLHPSSPVHRILDELVKNPETELPLYVIPYYKVDIWGDDTDYTNANLLTTKGIHYWYKPSMDSVAFYPWSSIKDISKGKCAYIINNDAKIVDANIDDNYIVIKKIWEYFCL